MELHSNYYWGKHSDNDNSDNNSDDGSDNNNDDDVIVMVIMVAITVMIMMIMVAMILIIIMIIMVIMIIFGCFYDNDCSMCDDALLIKLIMFYNNDDNDNYIDSNEIQMLLIFIFSLYLYLSFLRGKDVLYKNQSFDDIIKREIQVKKNR